MAAPSRHALIAATESGLVTPSRMALTLPALLAGRGGHQVRSYRFDGEPDQLGSVEHSADDDGWDRTTQTFEGSGADLGDDAGQLG
jgi:hypothetical protein